MYLINQNYRKELKREGDTEIYRSCIRGFFRTQHIFVSPFKNKTMTPKHSSAKSLAFKILLNAQHLANQGLEFD